MKAQNAAEQASAPPLSPEFGPGPALPSPYQFSLAIPSTLGLAIASASVSDSVQVEAYAQAFVHAFFSQEGLPPQYYLHSYLQAQILIAGLAGNVSHVVPHMFAQVDYPITSTVVC